MSNKYLVKVSKTVQLKSSLLATSENMRVTPAPTEEMFTLSFTQSHQFPEALWSKHVTFIERKNKKRSQPLANK